MKQILAIKDTLTNKISYFHILAFLATLPFDRFYSELVLISLLLHELIHLKRARRFPFFSAHWLPVLLYLLTVLGTLYSANKGQAFLEMEKQLAFLLFPLIFSMTGLDVKKYRSSILQFFAICCVTTIVYLFADAFLSIRYNKLPLSDLFSPSFMNHNFSLPIQLHATYLAMSVVLAAAICLYYYQKAGDTTSRVLYMVGLLILIAGTIQLSSRAVFLAGLVIVNILVPFLSPKGSRWKMAVAAVAASCIMVIALTRIQPFKTRYVAELKGDLARDVSKGETLEPRLARWQCAWSVAKESPVLGHGSGTEIMLLNERYFERQLYYSFLNGRLNAHNQYLSFLIKTGMIGLLVYFFVLFAAARKSISTRDLIFCSFLVIVSVVSFSENILDTNKGIFFFSFFYVFLMRAGNEPFDLSPGRPTSDFIQ